MARELIDDELWSVIEPHIPHRRQKQPRGLGKLRWEVERTLAWLHRFRRLRTRWERREDIPEAFLSLGCAMIGWRALQRSFRNGL